MARSRSRSQLELPLAADLGIAFSGRQAERSSPDATIEVMGYDTHDPRFHFLANFVTLYHHIDWMSIVRIDSVI